MTYSLDFRKKVLSAKEGECLSFAQVSERFKVGKGSVMRCSKNINSQTTRNKPATKIGMIALRRDVEVYPDAYLHERAERMAVSKGCIWLALQRLGVTYKKNTQSSQILPHRTTCLPAED